jgi:hypothetical protein
MGVRFGNASEPLFGVSEDAILVSEQPQDLGGPIEDEDTPPHPLVGAQPRKSAEECDRDVQEIEEVGKPVAEPTLVNFGLQSETP